MASNPNSQKKQQPFKWERILVIVQDIWTDKFPNDDNYDFSIWAEWESRISKGREEEEKRIAENIRQMESRLTPEQKESMPDDWFVDDYRHTYEVSNSMYAALVVSLWSCMEGLLKDLVGVCRQARRSNKKSSYKFGQIEDYFEKIGIKLELLPKYPVVNAVRILNNSFKHSEGLYMPKSGRPDTIINPNLLSRWKCISDRFVDLKAIDYTKLPIREIVIDCNLFCQSLLSAVKKNLEGL